MAPVKNKVLINVDLGEGFGNFSCGPDDDLIPLVDYANVACGGHAGDPMIMSNTVRKCKEHGVRVGAHPGLPDLQGFGRREMKMQPEELTALVRYQVGALTAFLRAEGMELSHIKAHGSLYGMTYRDETACRAVLAGVQTFKVPIFGLAGTMQERLASEMGVPFVAELYGDVKYNEEGTLVIDRVKKYVLATSYQPLRGFHSLLASGGLGADVYLYGRPWTEDDVKAHIRSQLHDSAVRAVSGKVIDLPIGDHPVSLCCHSDSPGALEIVRTAKGLVDEFNQGRG
ncbi:hypothetical protein MBLNU230_g8608t2 [Neophaeotheca triangularis]